MNEKIAGIILAGGKSIRFGEPKAFATKDGKAFYQHALDALTQIVEKIVMVTSPELKHRFQPIETKMTIIQDRGEYQGHGPLAGILTAMEQMEAEWYLVIPIDVPFMNPSIFRTLMKHIDRDVDAIIPIAEGKLQPLIAIYRDSVKGLIKHQLDHQHRSLRKLLDKCNVKYVDIEEEQSFININSQADYEKWIKKQEDN
ncbi:molybdenum cofactor guanylyltransferase [Oceanobacillus polygoni]|uniref:Probable molybdenum cofactor guanylyltransferase n=1 Tax=Oceanobacillus polygoni TaxID=1235259 RepID=A0A9X0YVZ3_9BACI|nr:molybdenum cofactor guanylyltransferase [Oceanobacillus polygoni]MBP2079875.1 molybdopterin-guanine dinucleotide biosynthesis protein A [Oceanobacillus polygoni]